MNRAKSQRRFVFACLAPAVILVALFMFWPTVNVFRMSLYRMGGITNRKEFIGLQNFKTLMEDKNFLEAMQNTILIIVMVMIFTIVLQFCLRRFCKEGNSRGRTFSALFSTYRTFSVSL